MSDQRRATNDPEDDTPTLYELLLRLDLATEVLEGLDELGLDSRSEVQELLAQLEAQVSDTP